MYVDEEYFDRIPEATEEEEDMLDLAFGLEETYHYLVLTGSVAMFVSHCFWSSRLPWWPVRVCTTVHALAAK